METLDTAIDFLTMLTESDFIMIYFIKKSGEKRLMKATLNFNKIPKNHHPKQYNLKNILTKIRKSKGLSVFDLEKIGWRSIPLENERIISITTDQNKILKYNIQMSDYLQMSD